MKHPSSFDEALAAELLGKYVIVGLRRVNMRGELKSQTQVHGKVVAADPRFGFRVVAEGLNKGKEFKLPPDTRAFHRMAPGVYRLDETDEDVTDPALRPTSRLQSETRNAPNYAFPADAFTLRAQVPSPTSWARRG